jgi:hypothetical protein
MPPFAEALRTRHASVLYHIVEYRWGHIYVGRGSFSADQPRRQCWRECDLAGHVILTQQCGSCLLSRNRCDTPRIDLIKVSTDAAYSDSELSMLLTLSSLKPRGKVL